MIGLLLGLSGGGLAVTASFFVWRSHKHQQRSEVCSAPETGTQIPNASPLGAGKNEMQGERSYMEDRAVVCALPGMDGALFAGMYDGHVGEAAAEFCAANLHELLAAKLATCAGDYEAALAATFCETNELFLQQAGEDESGTTACVMMRLGGVLYIANAGDSRCVLGSGDGTPPVQLTVDHRPDDANEYARIEAAGGELFDAEDGNGSRVCGPNSCMLACSRSIGDRHFKPVVTSEPDTFSRPISAGDAFAILASDGVWDELSNLKACNLVSSSLESGCSPSEAAATLCEAAHKAGSEDNISAIVVLLNR